MTLPPCGYALEGDRCAERGPHVCVARYTRVERFFARCLVHTKGVWARKPFVLEPWQRDRLVRPVFGPVVWDDEFECYRRQVSELWVEVARKNGKSEWAAGLALLMLCADDEESAEVYGGATDVPQARKVFDVAARMTALSPVLSKRLTVKDSARRIIDERTASYYEVVPSDEAGNLGHNPHCVILDEHLTQPDGSWWSAMTTARGARVQPLFAAFGTAGKDEQSWAGQEHKEAERIAENPARNPHRHVVLYNIPKDADVWDEANWPYANPALSSFLSLGKLREEAVAARNQPHRENDFRQYRANQWQNNAVRWLPVERWDGCAGEVAPTWEWVRARVAELRAPAWGGLDLSAKIDLTAWTVLVRHEGKRLALWRYWLPEARFAVLNDKMDGALEPWRRDGWITVTEGDVIDYDRVYTDVAADVDRFRVVSIGYDPWSGDNAVQAITKLTRVEFHPVAQTFAGMGPPMRELMGYIVAGTLEHYGNPVTRWNVDSLEVRLSPDDKDIVRPDKPERHKVTKRIDGVVSLACAVAEETTGEAPRRSAYADHGLVVVG